MTVDIDPVALAVGGLAIRWYGLIAAVAVATAYLLARRRAAASGIGAEIVADGAIWVGIAAVAGGRALYVLQNELAEVAANPLHALAVWHGGLSFYGSRPRAEAGASTVPTESYRSRGLPSR